MILLKLVRRLAPLYQPGTALLCHFCQFDVLAKDTDTPMVRRAVASNVGNFAGVVEGHLLLNDVVPVFEALASDDQDNVRLLAVEQAGKVAKALVDQVCIRSRPYIMY